MSKKELKIGNLQLIQVILGIVLITLVILPLTSWSETVPCKTLSFQNLFPKNQTYIPVNTTEAVICFKEKDGMQMILDIENTQDYKEQVDLLKQSTAELEKQVNLLRQVNELQDQQIQTAEQTVISYHNLLKAQKEAYEKEIENNKPSIWREIGIGIGAAGIGALMGALLF